MDGQSRDSGSGRAAEARTALKQKVVRLRDAMLEGLVDREEPVRLLLAAMLAGEHMLLVGPPGTAKSELARRLHGAIAGSAYFECLLTRFTVPEELFGPLSLKELENDRYVRRVDRYLPTASVAFVDEVFKANSAILNSLLTILNERLFDNGGARTKVPLACLVGASNELPKGEELSALYDRFLVRYQVGSVPASQFVDMALATDNEWVPPDPSLRLTESDLAAIREGARAVTVSPAVRDLLTGLREAQAELGLSVSDRRWKKIVKLLRTIALVDGRDEVLPWDFWVVSHCVWTSPEQRPAVQQWYEKHLGVDATTAPERVRRVIATMASVHLEMSTELEPVRGADGKVVYVGSDGEAHPDPAPRRATRGGEPLYLLPAHHGDRTRGGKGATAGELQEEMGEWRTREYIANRANHLMDVPTMRMRPKQHAASEIEQCIAHLRGTREQVDATLRDLAQQTKSAESLLASHLVVPVSFREPALAGLKNNSAMLHSVRGELWNLEEAFAKLPRRPERGPL